MTRSKPITKPQSLRSELAHFDALWSLLEAVLEEPDVHARVFHNKDLHDGEGAIVVSGIDGEDVAGCKICGQTR